MQKNLVIVESPAKAKTIEKFLGKDYKVLSSYGHIRDLKKKEFSIDVKDNYRPTYEVPFDKLKLVKELKSEAEKVGMVWLASDEDREGEAISWHLYEVLGLKPETTKRIVFHEITKTAILRAIENPREIDVNLVNAQQARRVLDRIVGFELSPVLWKKVKPALSAGRVQSVAVRLIVEREREVHAFVSEISYRVTAVFKVLHPETDEYVDVKAELGRRFKTKEEAKAFLEKCKDASFTISSIVTRPMKKSPAAPFTTSTLQQEASRKLGFSVSQTMLVAQHLYESGRITYMRTDSVNLSDLALNASKQVITDLMGEEFVKNRHYATKTKGAQEAHEAIRPTYMENQTISAPSQEQKLYELIWKRTVASQMADAQLEKTTATISISNSDEQFVATGEVVVFDGFLRVYKESFDEEPDVDDESHLLPPLSVGQKMDYSMIQATQRFSQSPARYSEASLVRKLEELGIGRPSTYAPTISTVQQRGYVEKGSCDGVERPCEILQLADNEIEETTKIEMTGNDRSKLIPTDMGIVVNDFLMSYFPNILDYNFTANVEKEFDEVAEGAKEWTGLMKNFYEDFHPLVEKTLNTDTKHKVGERILGTDPASGKVVSVKIARFGPVIQLGSSEDEEKPRYAKIVKGLSMETITLEEALNCFKLSRTLGDFEENSVMVGVGRFGPYIRFNDAYVSIPKEINPLEITLEDAIDLIKKKRKEEAEKVIKAFEDCPEMQVLKGRYGPYISYKKKNYKIPESVKPEELDLDGCFKVIEVQNTKAETRKQRRHTKKK